MNKTTYVSRFAEPIGRYGKRQVMHVSLSARGTLCGAKLADPYTVYGHSDYKLCTKCAATLERWNLETID